MGQPMLHKGIAVIILGGMGDIRGAMFGGLFLGFAEVLSVAYIGSDYARRGRLRPAVPGSAGRPNRYVRQRLERKV